MTDPTPPAPPTPEAQSEVRVIDTGISLDTVDSVDILLVQWNTANPVDANGVWHPADAPEVAAKRAVLRAIGAQLAAARKRPIFVVIPELSLPLELVGEVEALVDAGEKPIVVIAGLEHMTGEQYSALQGSFDAFTSPVNREPGRRLNAAAVWIGTAGVTRRYLQLKRGLADVEQHAFMRGDESFVFVSPDQREGRRLNFAVGICADFTNRERVLQWRREVGKHANTTALDLMFLLQMNPNQEAVQFRTAVAAYFDPPVPLAAPEATFVPTDKSALVFVNQAATEVDGTVFGRSAVHFYFNGTVVKRATGAPTFFLDDQSGHLHHSAVFREDRSAAYLLEWVPLHRRNVGAAGSNEPPVFRSARYCDLRQTPDTLHFTEISPVVHWLLRAWESAEKDIVAEAEANFRVGAKAAAVESWRRLWNSAIGWWRAQLKSDDSAARQQIAVLTRGAGSTEPRRWRLEESVRLLLRAFVLLIVGKERTVEPCGVACGSVTINQRVIAFVSGRRTWTWKTTTDQFYDAHRTLLDAVGVRPILVLQETSGDMPWNENYLLPADITVDGVIDADDITASPRRRSLRCTATARLYDQLCESTSFDSGCAAVAAAVDEVLS